MAYPQRRSHPSNAQLASLGLFFIYPFWPALVLVGVVGRCSLGCNPSVYWAQRRRDLGQLDLWVYVLSFVPLDDRAGDEYLHLPPLYCSGGLCLGSPLVGSSAFVYFIIYFNLVYSLARLPYTGHAGSNNFRQE